MLCPNTYTATRLHLTPNKHTTKQNKVTSSGKEHNLQFAQTIQSQYVAVEGIRWSF